jgi:hypothetical protein
VLRASVLCDTHPPLLQILHVSGLMESVSREQLRELFSQAGEVTKVDIPDGGRSMVRADSCTQFGTEECNFKPMIVS